MSELYTPRIPEPVGVAECGDPTICAREVYGTPLSFEQIYLMNPVLVWTNVRQKELVV